jgi:hypothetical protein
MWMFPRNIRNIEAWKLTQILQLVEAVDGNTQGQANQDDIYEQLSALGIKCERDPNGVSNPGGFRTYLAQLMCLGLYWEDPATKQLKLTHAGELILDADKPMNVLRCQLLRMQYPSVYGKGHNVCVDPSVRVKPFVFTVLLLQDKRLDGYLREEEAAVAVIYGRDFASYEKVVKKIQLMRQSNDFSMRNIIDSVNDVRTPRRCSEDAEKDLEKGITDAQEIANTLKNYMLAAQLANQTKKDRKFIFSLNDDPKILQEIAPWLGEKYNIDPLEEGYEAAWQQRYGRYEKAKTSTPKSRAKKDGFASLVSSQYIQAVKDNPYGFNEDEFIEETASRYGKKIQQVSLAVAPLRGQVESIAEDEVISASLSGGKQSRKLEIAVNNILRKLGFDLSEHIGQKTASGRKGGYPDIYIRSSASGICGLGDTKATANYGFDLSDVKKLGDYYKNCSSEIDPSVSCEYFLYIAGGFGKTIATIEANLKYASELFEAPVSALTVRALLALLKAQEKGEGALSVEQLETAFRSGEYFAGITEIRAIANAPKV